MCICYNQCLVRLLDTYLKLLPLNCSHFYMQPQDNFSPDKPGYTMQRVGINQIKKFMTEIMSFAGFSRYTNHCLRATAVSWMYNAGLPESLISEKCGLEELRVYEHPSDDLERTAEEALLEDLQMWKRMGIKWKISLNLLSQHLHNCLNYLIFQE